MSVGLSAILRDQEPGGCAWNPTAMSEQEAEESVWARSHAREEPTQNATEESARQNSRICVREHKKKRNKSILYRMQQFLLEYKYRRRNINIPHVPPDGMAEAMSK